MAHGEEMKVLIVLDGLPTFFIDYIYNIDKLHIHAIILVKNIIRKSKKKNFPRTQNSFSRIRSPNVIFRLTGPIFRWHMDFDLLLGHCGNRPNSSLLFEKRTH